jgi:hypothetical protein
MKRECGDCTRCCEGWLNADIYGKRMYEGKPCYYLGKGCTIYENRPEEPCKNYECEWLTNDEFPEWLKPNISNVIVTKREIENKSISYYEIVETGKLMKSPILNWFVHWALKTKSNIIYSIQGKMHKLGSAEFNSVFEESS